MTRTPRDNAEFLRGVLVAQLEIVAVSTRKDLNESDRLLLRELAGLIEQRAERTSAFLNRPDGES